MSEAELVQKIIKEVKRRYPRAWVRKIADRFTRGLPDIVILVPTLPVRMQEGIFFLAVECKAPKGVATPIQRAEGEVINRLPGAIWMVAKDLDSVLSVLAKQGAVP